MGESIEIPENKGSTYQYETALQITLLMIRFQDILKHARNVDVNQSYTGHDSETSSKIARNNRNKKFRRLVLEYGAHANLLNNLHGKALIHQGISNSNYSLLLFMENNNILFNEPNSGETAIPLAAQQGEDFMQLLKWYLATKLNAKNEIPANTHNITEHLEIDNINYSDLHQFEEYHIASEDRLFSLLKAGNHEAFEAEANIDNVHDGNGQYTYLQYACKFGLSSIVRVLLDLEVDINKTTPSTSMTPIMLAAYKGHFDIVRMLVDTGRISYTSLYGRSDGTSLLRALFFGVMIRVENRTSESVHHFYKCLEYLFDNIPMDQMDELLNQYRVRSSLLWHAMYFDHRNGIRLLLEKGAYIGTKSLFGEMLIKGMKAATLKYLIDENITYDEGHHMIENCKIIIDFNFLVCKNTDQFVTETQPLVAISEVPQLRPLLNHPFFIAYLDLKRYMMMSKIAIVNYFFYLIFVLCLSAYLVITYASITTKLSKNDPTHNTEDLNYENQKDRILWYVIFLLNSILFCRELTQFTISFTEKKCKCIKSVQCWIDLILIGVIFVILFGKIRSTECRSSLTVTTIFLSWLRLMLLIVLSHPRTSVYLVMFKTVARNTFKFLLCYFILIVAFALSFHILLKDTSSEDFGDISLSLFRTWIMSVGEYEVENHKFGEQFGIRHLFFALFTFLIPIVLMNLSNGVAVSDIQRIRQEAEIVTAVSRVKSIARAEEILSDTSSFFCKIAYYYYTLIRRYSKAETNDYCDALKQHYHRYINLVSNFSEDGKVYILPNRNNYVFMKEKVNREQTDQSSTNCNTPRLFISASTVEYIKRILNERFTDEKKSTHDEIRAEVMGAITKWQQKTEDSFQILEQKMEDRFQNIEQKLSIIIQTIVKGE